jgi:methylglutaconyl-CoA hydratase
MASVDYYADGGAGVITLSRSSEGNRLNIVSLKELHAALHAALDDKGVRAVLLRSNGAVFSLGLDFSAVADENSSAEEAVGLYRGILYTLFTCAKPVISVVQGDVKAGGLGIVCASDIVLAAEHASAELSEVIFGLIPANVLPYVLQTRISVSKARYVILTAKRMDAREAYRLGLFDEVFPPEQLEKGVKKICKQLFRSSPEALARTKAFTAKLMETPFSRRPALAEGELLEIFGNKDSRQAIIQFQEGELPSWFASFSPQRPLVLKPEE